MALLKRARQVCAVKGLRLATALTGVIAACWWGGVARSHEDLARLVHHHATFRLDDRNIDTNTELRFYGMYARTERQRMDENGDRRVQGGELATYVRHIAETTAHAAGIYLNDRPLRTMTLYEPKIDLQQSWACDETPVVIRLSYFARRPDGLAEGATLRFQDTLWQGLPALCITKADPSSSPALTPEDGLRQRFDKGETRIHAVQVATAASEEEAS